jgi:Tol biopolymer transport system component
VLSLAGGRRHQVAATTFSNPGDVAWSPDGTKIAFVRYDYGLDGDRLLVVPADGSAPPREIAHTDRRGRIWTPAFSKDGTKVLYSVWFLH